MEFGTNSSIGKVKREKNPLRKVSLQRDRSSISLPLFLVSMFCSFYRRIDRIEKSSIQRNCNETLKASPPVFFFFLFPFFISSKRKRNISTGGGDDFNATRRKILCYCGWVIKIASGICTFFVVSIAKMGIFVSQVKVLFFLVVVNAN